MTYGTSDPECVINVELVRELLRDRHPDFAAAGIQLADEGWDNVTYRLGEPYAVRLPRREVAIALADHEHAWLPVLADRLPIPIPSPVRIGGPSDLPAIWMLFDELEVRTACLEHYQADPDVLARAKGWTVLFGTVFLETGLADHPRHTPWKGRIRCENSGRS